MLEQETITKASSVLTVEEMKRSDLVVMVCKMFSSYTCLVREPLSQAKISTQLVMPHTSNSQHQGFIYLDEGTGTFNRNLLVK